MTCEDAVNTTIRIIAEYNDAIDDLFADPHWKDNIEQHYAALLKIQKKTQVNLVQIAGQVLGDDTLWRGNTRYKSGKKEFALKNIPVLKKREGANWKHLRKDPEVIAVVADARKTLGYSPGTNDCDIFNILYRFIKHH